MTADDIFKAFAEAARAGQTSLDFSKKAFTDEALAEAITKAAAAKYLKELQSLDLRNTRVGDEGLTALAATGQLQQLRFLGLSGTRVGDKGLTALAATEQLQQLRSLCLSLTQVGDAGLTALAATGQLQQLQSLDLIGTQVGDAGLMTLAATGQLQQLQILDLGGTNVGDAGLTALAATGQLQYLQYLILENTQVGNAGLTALAATGQLRQLQHLELSGTQVGDAGLRNLVAVGQLGQLHFLGLNRTHVKDTGLTALATCGQLRHLETLNLRSTQVGDAGLTALATGQLQQLQFLDLDQTQVCAVDAATLKSRDAKSIFAAILHGIALHVARVMFIGTTNVGKTWLVRRCFLNETVDPDEPRQSTRNIELVHPGNYQWQPTLNIGKENVRIETRVWDFAGQLVTHGVHEVFLPDDGRTIYVLVLSAKHLLGSLIVDGEENGNAIIYWLKCIRYFVGEVAQVVLAITQCDCPPSERKIDDEILAAVQKKLSQLTPLNLKAKFDVAVSAIVDNCSACESTETSIVPLRRQIEAALELRHQIREAKVPPELVRVREKVENELSADALVNVDTFREWCRQCGVAEKRTQETFLRILHHMGCLFYFGHTRQEEQELDRQRREELKLAPGHKRFLQRERDTVLQTYLANPIWLKQAVYEAVQWSRDNPWISKQEMEDLMQQAHAGVRHVEGHFFARKFLDFVELSYFDEETWRYLLPRGLKPGRPLGYYDWPKASLQWSLSDSRKRQHQNAMETQMCFFHESAFHRFLVRMHKEGCVVSEGNSYQHWRDCIVLKLDGCTLAVAARPDEGLIEMGFIEGQEQDRRKAFEEVRRLFVKEFICQEPAPGSDTGPPTKKAAQATARSLPNDDHSDKLAVEAARREFFRMREIVDEALEIEDRPKQEALALLEKAYYDSRNLTDALKKAYRLAAVFCCLSKCSFPIDLSQWSQTKGSEWKLKRSGDRLVFEEGLKIFADKLGRKTLEEQFDENVIEPRANQTKGQNTEKKSPAYQQAERLRRAYERAVDELDPHLKLNKDDVPADRSQQTGRTRRRRGKG